MAHLPKAAIHTRAGFRYILLNIAVGFVAYAAKQQEPAGTNSGEQPIHLVRPRGTRSTHFGDEISSTIVAVQSASGRGQARADAPPAAGARQLTRPPSRAARAPSPPSQPQTTDSRLPHMNAFFFPSLYLIEYIDGGVRSPDVRLSPLRAFTLLDLEPE
ncbi:hypothetical protein BN2475_280059 [Paraburkholderia ribeironis]|uniref:Uncharacterized protein n=1 Tax=Paraburkholderia ribeironis TaxID=1247936 RepID=A0A1N7S2H9_9BURK|nr:hypothetical protein [Paraburkholderia ribeironis]SIT41187.1 hypothetical protein BN2475_280059 [Paraburkholderia ribeironis]